tara:strand:- start:4328 stop:4726 length:399 start_codon:yes stop_codon:yes gene_type:complete
MNNIDARVVIEGDMINEATAFTSDKLAKEMFKPMELVDMHREATECMTKAFRGKFSEIVLEKYYPTLKKHISNRESVAVTVEKGEWAIMLAYTEDTEVNHVAVMPGRAIFQCQVVSIDGGLLSIVASVKVNA